MNKYCIIYKLGKHSFDQVVDAENVEKSIEEFKTRNIKFDSILHIETLKINV